MSDEANNFVGDALAKLVEYVHSPQQFEGGSDYTRKMSRMVSEYRSNIAARINETATLTNEVFFDIVEEERLHMEARILFPENEDPDIISEQTVEDEFKAVHDVVKDSDYLLFLKQDATPRLVGNNNEFLPDRYHAHKETIDQAYLDEVARFLRSDGQGLIDEAVVKESIRDFEKFLMVSALEDQATVLNGYVKDQIAAKNAPNFSIPGTIVNGTLKAFTDGLEAKKSTAKEIAEAPAFRKVLIAVEDGVLDKVIDFARNFYRSGDEVEERKTLAQKTLKEIVDTVKIQALREIYQDYTTDGQQLQAGVLPRHREVLASSYAEYLRKNHLLDEKGWVEAAQYYPFKETIDAAFKNATTSESPEDQITAFENYLKTLSITKASKAVTEEWNTQTWLVGKSTEKLVVGTDTGQQWINN
jgi:hypothetical protein